MARTRESLERRLDEERENLSLIEEKIAEYTKLEAPIHLLKQRSKTQKRIAQIEEQLRHIPPEPSPPEHGPPRSKWQILLETPYWKMYAGCLAAVVLIVGVLTILLIPAVGRFPVVDRYLGWLHPPTPTPTKTPITVLSPTITDTPTLTLVPSPTPTPTPHYVEIVVDASERMSAEFEGGITKMESAWQTAGTIARTRAQKGQFVSIRTFGSGGEQTDMGCFESYPVFSFTNQDSEIKAHLTTPPIPGGQAAVVTALTDASADLMAYENIGREIILLTGGEDGCSSDLSVFYSSDNQALWTQTFVILFADEDFGPFINLRAQGANINYNLVRDRAEAEAVAEQVAAATPPVPTATVTSPPPSPPTPTTGGTPRPKSTPKPPSPSPTKIVATATRRPTPIAAQSPTHTGIPPDTPTPTGTAAPPTSTPTATQTPTDTPMPTNTPVSATAEVNPADAPKTIDGNINTYWQAAAENPWIKFDLGEVRQVVGFRETSWEFPGNPFTAWVSTDDVNYVQVASGTLTQSSFGNHFFTPQPVRYFKLFVQRTDEYGFGELAEFQALSR